MSSFNRTEVQAKAFGYKLLSRMKTAGWKLRVHENSGWHYSILIALPGRGRMSLYEDRSRKGDKYSVMINSGSHGGGEVHEGFCQSGSEPNKLVEAGLAAVKAHADSYYGFLVRLQSKLNSKK